MPTNPDFDWDEVIVSKKPKQKEIDVAFTSDPDIELGSIEVEDAVERPISSPGIPQCGEPNCSAGDDYLAALPYDEGTRTYGEANVYNSVDTPAAIRFRITDNPTWPDSNNVLDNYVTWNISARYPMTRATPLFKAPCENRYDRLNQDATFLNGGINSSVAFYPRQFENGAGMELTEGQSLTMRSVAGQYLFGRDEYGGIYGIAGDEVVWNFISARLLAYGRDSITGTYTGQNAGSIEVYANADLRVFDGDTSSASSRLTADSFNVGNNDSLRIREAVLEPDYPYFWYGDITGSYMFKTEIQIEMLSADSAWGWVYVEAEHVRSGLKVNMKQGFLATNLNGGLKLSDPWSLFPNGRGGMPETTRYWSRNSFAANTMYMIGYDGWEKEEIVRKACMEFERAQPHWQPAGYCDRIL